MKKKNLIIVLSVVLLLILLIAFDIRMLMKKANSIALLPQGDDAVNAMNDAEKAFFTDKIQKIEAGMTEENVIVILGPVYQYEVELGGMKIDSWQCPQADKDDFCLLRVKILNDKIYAIEWLKLNSFFWQKKFIDD